MKPILGVYGISDGCDGGYPMYTHDHNCALMIDGEIVHYCHLERYSRRKNDNRLEFFIEDLIDKFGIEDGDFELVSVNSFIGNDFRSKKGRLEIKPLGKELSLTSLNEAEGLYRNRKGESIIIKSSVISHELAHVFSCLPFFGMFKENSLLVHFDGGASKGNFSAYHYINGQVKLIESHWDLSHLSKLFNDNALAFRLMNAKKEEHCSVPGKFMGYAAMGTRDIKLQNWLKEHNYFKDIWNDDEEFLQSAAKLEWHGSLDDLEDSFLKNIAASIQGIFEDGILEKLELLKNKTKANYLYYTGGCALNIIANSRIVESSLFEDVFIPPPCNDSGLSLGAVAFAAWSNGDEVVPHSPYLNSLHCEQSGDIDKELISEVAKLIMDGAIIGICNDNGEVGPRALGNRSIIARADSVEIAKKLSEECKDREWFRPVAPIMLKKNAEAIIGSSPIHHLSKYMLLDFQIEPSYYDKLEGVIHSNGKARIQTLNSESQNPLMYHLLNALDKEYGQLALINTSFNYRGEPIVQTKADAIASAKMLKLDFLIYNGTLLNFK